ncbi:zinc finger protein 143-like isoform X2 [Varroa jacobsoni]|uniref:zinc finger protein 143-like isoform X2 n=1 Tax=Varroa jacobsoni TaxID=62625 RepID=UPI000BF5F831|nr:zinc finger protein 143-like isoform X2 [Varroa jacobsoni]
MPRKVADPLSVLQTRMKCYAKLMAFDPAKLDWPSYEIILDCFFKANNIVDNKQKISILRRRGGSTVCSILNEALASKRSQAENENRPDEAKSCELTAEDAIEALRVALHYEDGAAIKRLIFFRRVQQPNESISDYIRDLKQLGRACGFPKIRERLRDQLIAGIRSGEIRRRLLAERGELTMRKAFDIAQLWEELLSNSPALIEDFEKLQDRVRNLANDEPDEEDSVEKEGDHEGGVNGVVHIDVSPEQQNGKILSAESQDSGEPPRRKRGRPRKNPAVERIVIKVSLKDLASTTRNGVDEEECSESQTIKSSRGRPRRVKQEPTPAKNDRAELDSDTNEGSTIAPVAVKKRRKTKPPPDPNIPPKKRGRPLSAPMVPGGKRFKCQYCDYMTNTRQCVKRHEMTHTGEKPHPCSYCPLRFRERQHLQNHERLHTGELPYICEHCGRGFAKSSTLTDHIRTHTREAPHLCEFCGRGFIQKSALNTHVLIHTGRRPHVCSVCQKGFTTSNLLKTHMRIHNEAAAFVALKSTEQQATGTHAGAQSEHTLTTQMDKNIRSFQNENTREIRAASTDLSQQGEVLRCALETMEQRLPTTESGTDPMSMLRTMQMVHLAGYGGVQIKSEHGIIGTIPDDARAQESSQGSAVTPVSEEEISPGDASAAGPEDRNLHGEHGIQQLVGQSNPAILGLGAPGMPPHLMPQSTMLVPGIRSREPPVMVPLPHSHSLSNDLVPASSIIPW